MLKTTGARLFAALLGYVILVTLLLTLNPFFIAVPDKVIIKYVSSFSNLFNNILLFLPLGFLYRVMTHRRGAFLLGAGLSLLIEATQLFIPARTTSIIDVLANAAGAGLGALLYDLVSSRVELSSNMVSRFRLETPLMGLSYLMVPLLWIDTIALKEMPNRWLLTLLLGICGALIFGDLFGHWWDTVDLKVTIYACLAAGIWYIIGAGPRITRSIPLVTIGLGVMVLTALLTRSSRPVQDRRFEQSTLRHMLPFFLLYLLLLALWAPHTSFGDWHAFFGFTDRVTDGTYRLLYSRVEYLAAFTVLGYLIAEWRGRLELSLSQDLPHLIILVASSALILEIISGFQAGRGASLIRFVLILFGAGFGGTIYHLSRAHIQTLLGRPAETD